MKKPTYKFTTAERDRIRSWLEKKPGSDIHPKVWFFVKDDGTEVPITRVTNYLPGGMWKVRIAYTEDGGYPILMSGPLKASNQNQKTSLPPAKKAAGKMVPLNYAETMYAKGVVKPGAFQKAIQAEMDQLKADLKPFMWDDINPLVEESAEPNCSPKYITLKVSDDHQKHLDLYQQNMAYYKAQKYGTDYCQIPDCGCAGEPHA